MKKFEKNKGITIIVLVITIIVLLMLVGISVIMITREKGALKRTTEQESKTEREEDNFTPKQENNEIPNSESSNNELYSSSNETDSTSNKLEETKIIIKTDIDQLQNESDLKIVYQIDAGDPDDGYSRRYLISPDVINGKVQDCEISDYVGQNFAITPKYLGNNYKCVEVNIENNILKRDNDNVVNVKLNYIGESNINETMVVNRLIKSPDTDNIEKINKIKEIAQGPKIENYNCTGNIISFQLRNTKSTERYFRYQIITTDMVSVTDPNNYEGDGFWYYYEDALESNEVTDEIQIDVTLLEESNNIEYKDLIIVCEEIEPKSYDQNIDWNITEEGRGN